MITTIAAAIFALALILLVARKSYKTGIEEGYHRGQRDVLDRLEKKSLDKAHMARFGSFIQAGKEGRN